MSDDSEERARRKLEREFERAKAIAKRLDFIRCDICYAFHRPPACTEPPKMPWEVVPQEDLGEDWN